MAWTSPKTFISGDVLTAAELNVHLRDNLNETAVAKATTAGRIFVASGANTVAQREVASSFTQASINITGTSYGSSGPTVTVTTGTRALVFYGCHMRHATANNAPLMSVSVSGATTIAADDAWALISDGQPALNPIKAMSARLFKTLNAGSNTFNMQYRVAAGNADFERRELVVIAL